MDKKVKVFYCPYMQQDSTGFPSTMLAALFVGTEFDPKREIRPDGDFTKDGKIAAALKRLQVKYNLEPDGHWGPDTRKAFQTEFGFHPEEVFLPTKSHMIQPESAQE